MKPMRLIILGTALTAGIGAAVMVASSKPPAPPKLTIVQAPVATDAVLVASKALAVGDTIDNNDLNWQSWPKSAVPPKVIAKSTQPAAQNEYVGWWVRDPIGIGEPIYADRLIKPGSGFMSAILPSGMRAVAINIDQQGSQTAGGFIHPNDHVDVIHTYKDEDAARAGVPDPMVSETILHNIRILAIGQNIQERNNEKVVVGSNATLELTPQQVETIVLAQRTGQLSLALRSLVDSKATGPEDPTQKSTAITIVRFGVPVQARSR